MQKPSTGLSDAEDPIPIAGGVEDVEVVAGFGSAKPPLAGDALWPADVIEAMNFAAIGERGGKAVAALRWPDDHRDRTRLTQQPQGAKKIDRAVLGANLRLVRSICASTGVFGEVG